MRLYVLILVLMGFSCNKQEKQFQQELLLIQNYIADNNIQDVVQDADASFFYSILHKSNDTLSPVRYAGLRVEVNYKALLLDGSTVYSTNGKPDTIELDETIIGWQLALPLMDINDKMLLILPSRLGYGKEGSTNIPPNTVSVFEVELLDIFPHF